MNENSMAVNIIMALLDEKEWTVYFGDHDEDEAATRRNLADALTFDDWRTAFDDLLQNKGWYSSDVEKDELEFKNAFDTAKPYEKLTARVVSDELNHAIMQNNWLLAKTLIKALQHNYEYDQHVKSSNVS